MKNTLLILILSLSILASCSYRISTWHGVDIRNKSELRLLIKYTTIEDTGELILEPWNNGNLITQKTEIYSERIDSEEKVSPYSNEEFDKRITSLRIFRYENDTALTEIFADKPFTNLDLWDVSFSHDDEMDLHHYWLNITNEIAKN